MSDERNAGSDPADENAAGAVPEHVHRNVAAVTAMHADELRALTLPQRAIEGVGDAVGRPAALVSLLGVVALWIAGNALAPRFGLRALDPPPFPWLQLLVGVAALAWSNIVLITQRRLGRLADRRAHLDLQVNLLVEQRTAKIVALLEELRRDLPTVRDRPDPEAAALATGANPSLVLEVLEESLAHSVDPAPPDDPSGGGT